MNRIDDKIIFRFSLALLLLLGACAQTTAGNDTAVKSSVRQVTTHPDVDLAPRLSPDGKWLAFASNRAGNYDIWIKNMQTGRSRQLTTHKSDDLYPVWDKKNRYIIFVSMRSDAKGDLYRLNLRTVLGEIIAKGEPERLTTYMGFDGYPTISEYDEHIAWVSDRSGRPEIWLQTKRRKNVRQLTHGGATHPAWSPKQDYLAFTSFREDGGAGDIWIINLYAPRELFEVKTSTDSLERPMWPVTRGPAADGFPTWSPDANSIIFTRSDLDTDGDGVLSPADKSTLWSVDVSHVPGDSVRSANASFEIFRSSFNPYIATSAQPLTPAHLEAIQADYGTDGAIYYASKIKGNYDIWSFPAPFYFDGLESLSEIGRDFPLPQELHGQELARLVQYAESDSLPQNEITAIWNRIAALQTLTDPAIPSDEKWLAIYEIGVCYYLLGYETRADAYFRFLTKHAPDSESAAWAETLQSVIVSIDEQKPVQEQLQALIRSVNSIRARHPANLLYLAKSTLLLGDIWRTIDADTSRAYYEDVVSQYPQFAEICAHSQFNLAQLFIEQKEYRLAFQTYLNILQNYYEQREWMLKARDELVNLFVMDADDDAEKISRYEMIHAQFSRFDIIAIEPLMRAANLLTQRKDFEQALHMYDYIIAKYSRLSAQVFPARMARVRINLQTGEIIAAARDLQDIVRSYQASYPELAQQAKTELVKLLLNSAAELEASRNFDLAATRYKRVLELDAANLHAHQGYIASLNQLDKIDQAVEEYNAAVTGHPNDNILLYGLGLCYSYKGAPMQDGVFDPADVNDKYLVQSNDILQRALALDYNLIDAYLTLSFNYEMLENHQRWQKTTPKSFWRKAGGTIASPFVWMYHTATFYNETKAPRYYESAIQQLIKALALNDQKTQPRLEAMLALNLANNYYNLGEFGFRKAYDYYHLRLKYDSTFVDRRQEALFYERMGHCSLFVNDQKNGPSYLEHAIALFREIKDQNRVLINTKRLALLYEIGENSRAALQYYKEAAAMESERDFYDGLMRSYRSIAYHNFILHHAEEATLFADRALALMDSGKVVRSHGKPIYLQFGLLGLYVPFPYDLRKFGIKSSFQLSTDEEEAFIYTIFARNAFNNDDYDSAIVYIEKKLAIYEQRHDYDALATFQNNMGQIYFIKGDYDLAWRWFTNAYWMGRKTKYMGGQLLNIVNAGYVVLTMANDPDPAKRTRLLVCHNWITDKIRELLQLTAEDEISYAFYHAHMNLLLAELALIDPEHESAAAPLAVTAFRLSRAVDAESLLQRALDISRRYKLETEESSIRFRLGKLHALLGEHEAALAEFQAAREMAVQYNLPELLWQAEVAIGDMIAALQKEDGKRAFRYNPLDHYQRAIKISEANRIAHPGITASRMRRLYQEPYQKAAARLLALDQPVEALHTMERLRERVYHEILEHDKLKLRNERHQLLYYRADSLQREISAAEFRTLQNGRNKTTDDVQTTEDRILILQQDYEKTLAEIRREAPEIEPLIKISPVSLAKLQNELPRNVGVVFHIAVQDVSYLAGITSDSLSFVSVPIKKSELGVQLDAMMADARQGGPLHIPNDVQRLFAAMNSLPLKSHRVFIPDIDFLLYPWSAMSQRTKGEPIRSVSSSLTALYFSLQNVKPHGVSIYVAGDSARIGPLKLQGYEVQSATMQRMGDSFEAQRPSLAKTDIVHLAVAMDWNDVWPSRSSLEFTVAGSQTAKIRSIDLYGFNTSTAFLVNLDVQDAELYASQPEPLIAWERALAYTGIPALMLPLAAPDSLLLFYNTFYQNLRRNTLGRALAKTDSLFQAQGRPAEFNFYQVFGAGEIAVTSDSAVAAATQLAAQAERAFRDGDWSTTIDLCLRAKQQTGAALKEAAATDDLLLKAAVNAQDWDAALAVQRQRLARLLSGDKWVQAADGYALLTLFYEFAQQEAKAARTRRQFEKLEKRYGLHNDPVRAYGEIARIFEQGENFEQAQQLYLDAARRYAENGKVDRQCAALQKAADIVHRDLNDPVAALQLLRDALPLVQDDDHIHLRVDVLLKISRIYTDMQLPSKALIYARQADSLYTLSPDNEHKARITLRLADVLYRQGDLKRAQDRCKQLLSLSGVDAATRVNAMLLESKINADSHPDEALLLARRAFRRARETGDVALVADARRHLAITLWMQKNVKEAASLLQETWLSGVGTKRERMRQSLLLGAVLLDAGDLDRAGERLAQASEQGRQLRDPYTVAVAQLLLSRCVSGEKAMPMLNQAIALAGQLGFYDVAWRAHFIKAQNLAAQGRAAEEFSRALELLQQSSVSPSFLRYSNGLSLSERDGFKAGIRFFVGLGRFEDALVVLEKQKQRAFRRFVGDRSIPFQGDDRMWASRYDSLKENLFVTRARLAAQWPRDEALKRELQQAERSMTAFGQTLKTAAPHLYHIYFADDADASSFANLLPDSTGAFVFYCFKNELYTWFIDKNGVSFKQAPLQRDLLQKNIIDLREALHAPDSTAIPAASIYAALLRPWQDELVGLKQIIIVPDEIVRGIPFASLQSEDGMYLGLHCGISYAPRFSILTDRRTLSQRPINRSDAVAALFNATSELQEASFARHVATNLPIYFDSVLLLDEGQPLKKQIPKILDARIVYFGGRRHYKADFPFTSTIRRWTDEEISCEDVLSHGWPVDLVAIYGGDIDGDGYVSRVSIGLQECFINNGAGSVLAPMWQNDDLASAVLLTQFFQNLALGLPKAEALRRARRVVHDEINPHPAFWGGYRLDGDFR